MQNLPRAFGSLGHAGERRWAEIGFMWCARHSDSGRAYFATPVLDLACRQGITGIEQLCEPMEELVRVAQADARDLSRRRDSRAQPARRAGGPAVGVARRGHHAIRARARRSVFPARKRRKPVGVARSPAGFPHGRAQPAARTAARRLVRAPVRIEGKHVVAGQGPAVRRDGRPQRVRARGHAGPRRSNSCGTACRGAPAVRQLRPRRAEQIFREVGAELPKSGQVAWAPLFARYGDDVPRFQLIFDACEDLRVDARVQQRVPNYLARLMLPAASHRLRPPESAALLRSRAGHGRGRARDCPRTAVDAGCAAARPCSTRVRPSRIRSGLRTSSTSRNDARAGHRSQEIYQGAYLPGRGPECGASRARADRAGAAAADAGRRRRRKAGKEEGEQGENEDEQNAETGGERERRARENGRERRPERRLEQDVAAAKPTERRSRAAGRATRASPIPNGIIAKAATSATGAGCRKSRSRNRTSPKPTA